ncbi:MAG: hypothetical protein QOK40_2318 [Miltoncostaeaceae bacterium]|nr:hypothetical protein [Miltoncostaeaceae bacterium]
MATLAGLAALLAFPVTARAGEAELRAYEEATLGPEHAAQHAVARTAARRWAAMSQAQRAAAGRRERGVTRRTLAAGAATGPPAEVGKWTRAPFRLHGGGHGYAIHAALLHTGKILYYGYTRAGSDGTKSQNNSVAWLWNPRKGYGRKAFTKVYPPRIDADRNPRTRKTPAPIYCSGLSPLADGRILTVGGNLADEPRLAGRNQAFLFDPRTEKWQRLGRPKGSEGRWYPSQVLLGDGRTVILSGYTQFGSQRKSKTIEIYTPPSAGDRDGHFKLVKPEDSRSPGLYPHLWLMPNGEVFMGGPGGYDSWVLSPNDPEPWGPANPDNSFDEKSPDDAFPNERGYGTGVLRPDGPNVPSRVTLIGGLDYTDDSVGTSGDVATNTTETFDWSLSGSGLEGPHWVDDAPLNVARMNMNTVLLPDLSMVTVGGGAGEFGAAQEYSVVAPGESGRVHRRRQVELFDPVTSTWRLGPAQREDRSYHSTALLLPDGRVWSAGDDYYPHGGGADGYPLGDTGEIYSPPYLFKGKRPALTAAPSRIGWGESFSIKTSGPAVSRAVLAAPSAVTHANDMNQRLLPLTVGPTSGGATVTAPPTANVAPPGWYMLFALTADGVPSKARWVRLG